MQQAPAPISSTTSPKPEALEDQNIFTILGVTDGTPEEREQFLDELQQVIWEDFLEHDVKLLITTEEYTQFQQLVQQKSGNDLEQQEKIVTFLSTLVPDLEEIMLEKALELKGDMVRERIAGMKEYYAQQPQALEQITRAESLIAEDKWASASDVLNSIAA